MEEFKNEVVEKHHLALGTSESKAKDSILTDPQVLADHVPSYLPFKRWVNSFRVKKSYRAQQSSRYVEGWSDSTTARYDNSSLLLCGGQDLQWERLSGHSSNLETVKTSTLSVGGSIESLRPALSYAIDEEAHNRAIKRRKVLREIIATESDYVFGLKALANVYRVSSS